MKTLIGIFLFNILLLNTGFSQVQKDDHFSALVSTKVPARNIGKDILIGAGLEYRYNPGELPEVYSGVIGYIGSGNQTLELNTGLRTYIKPSKRDFFLELGGIGLIGFLNKRGITAGLTTGAGYRFGKDRKYFVKFNANILFMDKTSSAYGFSAGMSF